MSTVPTVQTSLDAVDLVGVSALTAARTVSDARRGAVYDPFTLAAVAPLHVHPLPDGRYLLLYSRRWYDATPSDTDPGGYTDFSEDLAPGWRILSAPTGLRQTPHLTPSPAATADTVTLTGAVTQAADSLFLLSSATTDGDTVGVVAHWWVNSTTAQLSCLAEETVPGTDAVAFDRGLWLAPPHLLVFGTDADGVLYLARKPWTRIGVTVTSATPDPRWTYLGTAGWSTDPATLTPVLGTDGPLGSAAPVSVATYRDRTLLATVTADGDDRNAVVYTTRAGAPWTRTGQQIALGTATTMMGAGLRFAQHLPADPARIGQASAAAVPYVTSTLVVDGGTSRLENTWALWPVPR